MKIKIFADGADPTEMARQVASGQVQGFTTNPTLMRKHGVTDYETFARAALAAVGDLPISFEVIADNINEMYRQAKLLASWGENVYVKIPITNTGGESTLQLIGQLHLEGVKVNVTAVTLINQVQDIAEQLRENRDVPSYVSVFAGRIADTGVDPCPTIRQALYALRRHWESELIWASPREVLNVIQAEQLGCDIITVTNDLLKKLSIIGKDLRQYSLETVKMFYNDAVSSGLRL